MPVFICLLGTFIDSKSSTGGVPFIWMMLWLLPIAVSLGIAIRRRALLSYESMRPISRSAFLKELAFAVGLQFTEVWIAIAATLIIAAALSTPHLLGDPHIWLYLVTSYMVQLVLLATVLWLLRLTTNMLLYMLIFMLLVFVAPFGSNLHGVNLFAPFSCIAGILGIIIVAAVLAALILADAYRRWLRTDLP